jgi:biopolymer transport protein ExbD
MRRFSQRNSLVTLSDINITPLLDLAFVLLIIFVITTPLLEKGLSVQLPSGAGLPDKAPLQRKDIRMVEVSNTGYYRLASRKMELPQIMQQLVRDSKSNPNMVIYIRADENGKYKLVADILVACELAGLNRVSLATDPQPKP